MTGAARRWTLLLLLAAALTGLGAGPASAHDELIATDPAVGAAVAQAPSAVTLTFSENVLPTGAAIEVSGADGVAWSTGDVSISGAQVRRPLRAGAPAGAYTVTWRVVSADGHPVSGQFGFAVTEGASNGTKAPSPTAATELSATATSAASSGAAGDAGSGRTSVVATVVICGVGALVLGFLVFGIRRLVKSRRQRRAETPDPPDRPDSPDPPRRPLSC